MTQAVWCLGVITLGLSAMPRLENGGRVRVRRQDKSLN